MRRLAIDCVYSMLAELQRISLSTARFDLPFQLDFDTSDFGRINRRDGLRLSIYDLHTLDEYEIGRLMTVDGCVFDPNLTKHSGGENL